MELNTEVHICNSEVLVVVSRFGLGSKYNLRDV